MGARPGATDSKLRDAADFIKGRVTHHVSVQSHAAWGFPCGRERRGVGVPFSSRHQDPAVLLLTRVRALSADHDGEHMAADRCTVDCKSPCRTLWTLGSNALPQCSLEQRRRQCDGLLNGGKS
jgi:hypothetical protein